MAQWRVIATRQTGLSHKKKELPCQDYVVCDKNNRSMAATLADGVGSLKHSDIASQVATKAAATWLLDNDERLCRAQSTTETEKLLKEELLSYVQKAIVDEAALRNLELKDLNCNLAFVLICPSADMALAGQLGDCAICVICNDRPVRKSYVISDNSGMANSTNTVMSHSAAAGLGFTVIKPLEKSALEGFILTSDGLDGALYRKNSKLVRKTAESFFNLMLLEESKAQVSLEKKLNRLTKEQGGYFDDDISIAILSRAKAEVNLAEDPTWKCKCSTRNSMMTTYCRDCNEDFVNLYPGPVVNKMGFDEFFLYYNSHPEEEDKYIQRFIAAQKPPAEPTNQTDRGFPKERKASSADIGAVQNQGVLPDQHSVADTMDEPRNVPNNSGKQEQKNNTPGGMDSRSQNALERNRQLLRPGNHGPVPSQEVGKKSNGQVQADGDKQQPRKWKWWVIVFLLVLIFSVAFLMKNCGFGELLLGPNDGEGLHSDNRGDDVSYVDQERQTDPDDTTEAEDPTDSTSVSTGEFPDNYLEMDGGSYYLGDVRNGKPHGFGSMHKDGTVWTGEFEDGKKNGVFTVTTEGDPVHVMQVIYEYDTECEVLYDSAQPDNTQEDNRPQYQMVKNLKNLRVEASYAAETNPVNLNKGDIVSILDEKTVNEVLWYQIETADGKNGWCEAEYIAEVLS